MVAQRIRHIGGQREPLRCWTWEEAIGGHHIVIEGPRDLARAFPTWFRPDAFSHVEPASEAERQVPAG
jgi:hypothetical protein